MEDESGAVMKGNLVLSLSGLNLSQHVLALCSCLCWYTHEILHLALPMSLQLYPKPHDRDHAQFIFLSLEIHRKQYTRCLLNEGMNMQLNSSFSNTELYAKYCIKF